MFSSRSKSLAIACLLFVAITPTVRSEEKIVWLTGPKLSQALKSKVSFQWNDRPLREGLQQLSRSTSVAILLDRRIDSSLPVGLSVTNVPLADAVKSVAEEFQGSVALIGSVVYLGPRSTASQVQALATLREREAAGNDAHKRWQARGVASWPELSQPRDLAVVIVEGAGSKLVNADELPHDVWPAWEGPPLSAAQRLSLILAGFDLTFEFDGQAVRILPAPVEEHAEASDILAGQKKTTSQKILKKGEKRYTLKVENQPIGAIVRTISKELDVEVQAPESLVEKLTPRISFDVKQVTAAELLKKVLDPAGIKFKLTEKMLELSE